MSQKLIADTLYAVECLRALLIIGVIQGRPSEPGNATWTQVIIAAKYKLDDVFDTPTWLERRSQQ